MPRERTDIEAYFASFPDQVQQRLRQIQATALEVVPNAELRIKYQMLAFYLGNDYLFYCGAFKNHIGIYPIPSGDPLLDEAVMPFKKEKSTLQFLHRDPLPLALIQPLIMVRLKELGR